MWLDGQWVTAMRSGLLAAILLLTPILPALATDYESQRRAEAQRLEYNRQMQQYKAQQDAQRQA